MSDDEHPARRLSVEGLESAILDAARQARVGVIVSVACEGGERAEYASDVAAELLGCEPGGPLRERAGHRIPAIRRWREQRVRGEANAPLEIELAFGTASVRATRTKICGSDAEVELYLETGERRRAAQALERSTLRFRSLVDAAPDGIVIGLRSRLVYANPAALRLLGYDDIDQLTSPPLADHVHRDDLPLVFDRARELRQTGRALPPAEVRVRHRNGDFVLLEIVDMLVEWDGEAAVLAIVRDLRERRQLQAQHVQTDRLAALGTLAAGVAHEINNPLAYVLLNLQYLRRELPRFAGEVERLEQFFERLGEARHGADRVSTIVRDLRAFSRVDQTPRGPTDLRRVLSSALKVAAPELANRARIVEDYEQVPLVEGDASRLEQVFLNLLVNAAQALNGQDPAHDEIRVTLRADEPGQVVVEVSDNGAGIAPDVLDRVFDPFFSTKPIGVGTGLGLPICHSIVTSLGGDIRVQSELGRGTTFRVTLPALSAADRRPAYLPTPMPASPESSRTRVLVVDDELPLASMLSRVLADDHAVRITSSAREALEILLGSEEFDLVLCDLLMPGMSGMDLYRELREQRPGLERRLVFMTGGAFTPRASDFLASVPNARIEKPFDLKQVRRLVREIERALAR